MEDWTHSEHHAGFDIPSNRIMRLINDYVIQYDLNNEDIVYWITGHSRGAAIANIIGMTYEKTGRECFTYAFATPNTTMVSEEEASSYRSIFNIVNADDFVPALPLTEWNYRRYGRTTRESVKGEYAIYFKNKTRYEYLASPYLKEEALLSIYDIIDGDPREESYQYTCACHGDGTSDNISVVYKRYSSKRNRDLAFEHVLTDIPVNVKIHCVLSKPNHAEYHNESSESWNINMCQTPMYFFQTLAAVKVGIVPMLEFPAYNFGERYLDAKAKMSLASLYMTNPHMTESYYVLSEHLDGGSFK